MGLGPITAEALWIYFLTLIVVQAVLSKFILRALLLYAARRRSSNVSRSVDGLMHFTKNVFAIVLQFLLAVDSQTSRSEKNFLACGRLSGLQV